MGIENKPAEYALPTQGRRYANLDMTRPSTGGGGYDGPAEPPTPTPAPTPPTKRAQTIIKSTLG
ncbi:MAG: hypothetical protein SFW65_01720 [Alphaproteobacteria bacterium]|nr:hypothetical protein [Alphaproteobacteria bacterium]